MSARRLLVLAAVVGCAPAGPVELRVSAAMSLKEAFVALEPGFEARHPGVDVVYNFAGSQVLSAQIVEGAQVDVFASADELQMERAVHTGRMARAAVFARNRLVLVTPADQPGKVAGPADLASPGLRLVLAGPTVPAGAYAREALGRLGVAEPALANIVSNEENVRGVVGKVAAGEADAGIVYATDVTPAVAHKLRALPLDVDVTPRYEVAALKDSIHPTLARAFADELLAPAAQQTLADHGFLPP
jgi:molybdate transport system substrate-binding protein